MYEQFYGFAHSPFSLTPDPKFLYRSESHDNALQQVWQAIRRKEGFIVLTGDIGTGKTTLCRTILEQFDPTTFTALILNPFLSLEELLRDVLLAYGVVSRDGLRDGRLATATRHELIRTLHDFLSSLEPIHGSAVLIIDEAQHLSPEVLEEIRILSNLETNERKLLLIVLVGQLNLLDVLRDAKLRQLEQRISIRCLLQPLNREGVEAYITHRLWVARGASAVVFTKDAIDLVYAISGGVPRVINLLCDRALMAGADVQTETITETHVTDAATNLGLTLPARVRRVPNLPSARAMRVAALVAIVLVAIISGGYALIVGNPFARGGSDALPAVKGPTPSSMGVRVPTPLSPDALPSLAPPNIETGAFSVVVGTYETPQETEKIVKSLQDRQLPVYAADITMDDGIRRRRLLVGRYAVREDAVKVRTDLAPSFPEAKIIYGWFERVP